MRQYARSVVVVAIVTLAPMQARAECAWVLWGAELGGQPIAIAGYKSIADCQREKKAWEAREDSRLPAALDAPRQGIDNPPATGASLGSFRCLPDAIDPRGPKGGGR
jgi:hypothetical protein